MGIGGALDRRGLRPGITFGSRWFPRRTGCSADRKGLAQTTCDAPSFRQEIAPLAIAVAKAGGFRAGSRSPEAPGLLHPVIERMRLPPRAKTSWVKTPTAFASRRRVAISFGRKLSAMLTATQPAWRMPR